MHTLITQQTVGLITQQTVGLIHSGTTGTLRRLGFWGQKKRLDRRLDHVNPQLTRWSGPGKPPLSHKRQLNLAP